MADFKGSLIGTGHCTRLGSADSGLVAEVGGWNGKVVVRVWRDKATGKDRAAIRLEPAPRGGVSRYLWEGWLDGET